MTNGFKAASRWVGEIEKHLDSVQDVMMRALRDCQPYHEMIREAKAAAKAEGISVKLLNGALKERKFLRSIVKNRAELDEDIADDFDEFVAALEPVKGLPLFDNAREAAEEKRERSKRKTDRQKAEAADIDDLAGDPQTAANVVALKGGIKPLDS